MHGAEILIAGATGTNGRALLEQLAARNVAVRALVRDTGRAASIASNTVELVQGDLADPASLTAAFDGIKKAFIVTAVHKDSQQWFNNFFQAARSAGVRHLVKYSGYGANKASPSEIITEHGRSDRTLIEMGIPYTILRPNSFYQNMFWQAEGIKSDDRFFLPLGDARQSCVDVRDIAEATARILTEEGHLNKAYDLTGPESLSFHEVASILSDLLGKAITYVPVPIEAAKASMLEAGLPEWDARVLSEIQGVFGLGLYDKVTDDLALLLERKPRTFRDFAADYLPAFGR